MSDVTQPIKYPIQIPQGIQDKINALINSGKSMEEQNAEIIPLLDEAEKIYEGEKAELIRRINSGEVLVSISTSHPMFDLFVQGYIQAMETKADSPTLKHCSIPLINT